MIIGSKFLGDEREAAKLVQHDMYWSCVGLIPIVAHRHWETAAAKGEVVSILGRLVDSNSPFDHRSLQEAHDLIAAQFRWLRAASLDGPVEEPDRKRDLRIAGEWHTFLVLELEDLCKEPDFVHAVLQVVAMNNTQRGYEAEDRVEAILHERYKAWYVQKAGKPESGSTSRHPEQQT